MNKPLRKAVEVLASGGVVAYPTEAVYGLGCRADDESAVLRILELKQRPAESGLIVLVDSLDMLGDWIDSVAPDRRARLDATWPGPVTWLLPATGRCPAWLSGRHGSLAVRHSAHPTCAALVAGLGRPLVSTSANLGGRPPATRAGEVREVFPEGIDLIVDGAIGGAPAPSEIRDLVTGQRLR